MTPLGGVGWDGLVADAVLPIAPLERDLRADLVIVGAGASGLAAAVHAASRGADVVVLDSVGVAAGAAGRNGGFLLAGLADFHHEAVARHGREFALRWWHLTVEELDRTVEAHPGVVRRTGSLRIAASAAEHDDIRAHHEAMAADGLAADGFDGPEGVGLLVHGDAVVNPVARCRALAASAMAAGVRVFAPAHVTDIEPCANGVAVEVLGPEDSSVYVTTTRVVVAVDGGLENLFPELAGRVTTSRLQMLATAPEPTRLLTRPVYRRWGFDYVQQLDSGEVFIGGGRDRHVDAELGAPAEPSDAVQRHLDELRHDLGLTAPVTHRWAAHAAFTLDRLPVAEEVRHGVLVAGAYNGHGNLLGTLLARDAVDAALDQREWAPLRPVA